MKSAGSDQAPVSSSRDEPSSGVRSSGAPLHVERICRSCGVNLAGKPRAKNVDGDYRCMPCHRRRKVVREALGGVRRQVKRFAISSVVALGICFALLSVMRSCGEPAPAAPSGE